MQTNKPNPLQEESRLTRERAKIVNSRRVTLEMDLDGEWKDEAREATIIIKGKSQSLEIGEEKGEDEEGFQSSSSTSKSEFEGVGTAKVRIFVGHKNEEESHLTLLEGVSNNNGKDANSCLADLELSKRKKKKRKKVKLFSGSWLLSRVYNIR